MIQIPKPLLPHVAVHYSVSQNNESSQLCDIYANDVIEKETIIKNIRIEPYTKLITAKDDRQIKLSALLIWDIKNSTPCEFKVGDIIRFGGEKYKIETIEKLYGNSKLHHLEIGLT